MRIFFDFIVAKNNGGSTPVRRAGLVALVAISALTLGATAGSLTPSALPASTMHSLSEVYASIASSAFDSSAITANQNGSLIAQLKYMNNQLAWASSSNNIWSLNSGNVGIGTVSPTTKLDVGGSASVSGNFELSGFVTSDLTPRTANVFSLGTSALGWSNLFATNASLSGNLESSVASVSQLYVGGSVINTGNFRPASNSLDYDEFVDSMTLDAATAVALSGFNYAFTGTGNVGIGTAAPGAKLDVAGTASISGNVGIVQNTSVGTVLRVANDNAGVFAHAGVEVGNSPGIPSAALQLYTLGTGYSTLGYYVQDGATVLAGGGLSGGLSIGTLGSVETRFYTNSAERMRIDSVGNIGIGTSDVNAKLEVAGTASVSGNISSLQSSTGSSLIHISNNNAGAGAYAGVEVSNVHSSFADSLQLYALGTGYTTGTYYTQDAAAVLAGANLSGGMSIGTVGVAPVRFYTGGTEYMRLMQTSGNLGIGATTPAAKLEVAGSIIASASNASEVGVNVANYNSGAAAYAAVTVGNVAGSFNDSLQLLALGTGYTSGTYYTQDAGTVLAGTGLSGGLSVGTLSNTDARFYSNALERMRLTSGGNLGIGTSSIETKFEVAGTASVSGVTRVFNVINSYGSTDVITGPTSATTLTSGLSLMYDPTNNKGVMRSVLSGVAYEPLYFQANEFRWAVGTGSPIEKMVLDVNGNLGIGTTSPGTQKMELAGTASISGILTLWNTLSVSGAGETITGPTSATNVSSALHSGFDATNLKAFIRSVGGASYRPLYFQGSEFRWAVGTSGLTEKMVLDVNGNLGIGTTAPDSLLEIAGGRASISYAAGSGDTTMRITNPGTGPTNSNVLIVSGGATDTATAGNNARIAIVQTTATNGNFGGISFFNSGGGRGAGIYARFNDHDASPQTDLTFLTSNNTSEATSMILTQAGNLGIGTGLFAESRLEMSGLASISHSARALTVTVGSGAPGVALFTGLRGSTSNFRDNASVGIQQKDSTAGNYASLFFYSGGGQDAAGIGAHILDGDATPIGDLYFATNNNTGASTIKSVLTAAGNWGVGDLTPEQMLTVAGTILASSSVDALYEGLIVSNQNAGTSATAYSEFRNGPTIGDALIVGVRGTGYVDATNSADSGFVGTSTNLSGGLLISTGADAPIRFMTSGAGAGERMRITGGGNVGIGTVSPDQLFDVAGNILASGSGNIDLTLNSVSNSDAKFTLRSAGTSARLDILGSASQAFVSIASSGNVGIGTSAPGAKLEVQGSAVVSGTVTSTKLITDFQVSNNSFALCHESSGAASTEEILDCKDAPSADYMEQYPMDASVEEGEIVAPSATAWVTTTTKGDRVPKLVRATTAERDLIMGITSVEADAGDFNSIGYNIRPEDNPKPLALSGRVKVKVNLDGGPIAIGDPITISSVPGVGMKATTAGQIAAIALEPLDSLTSETYHQIMVFVGPRYWAPSADAVVAGSSSMLADVGTSWLHWDFQSLFASIVDAFRDLFGITFGSDGSIRAKQLCLDDVCVTKEQLLQLLGSPSPTPSPLASPLSPTPTPSEPTPSEPTPSALPPTPSPSPTSTPEPTPSEPTPSALPPTPSDLPLAPIAST